MKQSRRMSLAESLSNIAIGYVVAVSAQSVVFPWFGINTPLRDNLAIGGIFTAISMVRSYALRRFYNSIGVR
jgi:hypothetical protein